MLNIRYVIKHLILIRDNNWDSYETRTWCMYSYDILVWYTCENLTWYSCEARLIVLKRAADIVFVLARLSYIIALHGHVLLCTVRACTSAYCMDMYTIKVLINFMHVPSIGVLKAISISAFHCILPGRHCSIEWTRQVTSLNSSRDRSWQSPGRRVVSRFHLISHPFGLICRL